jgi:hypothetical protein
MSEEVQGPTPITVKSENSLFKLPKKYRVHKYRYSRVTFTFEKEDLESPWFPTFFALLALSRKFVDYL